MTIEQDIATIMQWMEDKSTQLDEIHEILTGGANPSVGLVVRFAKVENFFNGLSKAVWLFGGACLTGIAGYVLSVVL